MSATLPKPPATTEAIPADNIPLYQALPDDLTLVQAIPKLKAGRPPRYSSPYAMEKRGLAYLENARKDKETITITGLAYSIGTTRKGLERLREVERYKTVITRLISLVEIEYEKKLSSPHVQGAKFALTNLGWKETPEVQTNIALSLASLYDQARKVKAGEIQPPGTK